MAQNLANHRRLVPAFHIGLGLLVAVNLVHAALALRHYSSDRLYALIVAAALALVFWYMRQFPLRVQDRVILLEMRLRLGERAPDLAARFDQLTPAQVIALRFAGDDELPALAREVLDGKLTAPNAIKQRIRNWRADDLRA